MTRETAKAELRRLANALSPGHTGVARLQERITSHDDRDALQSALMEIGAHALLDGAPKDDVRRDRVRGAVERFVERAR